MKITTRFDASDIETANAEWGCNCGPVAIAACLWMSLDEVREAMPNFRGFMSPTDIKNTLSKAGYSIKSVWRWPARGIIRVQFTGPWTGPGANPRWAYRYTHWAAAWTDGDTEAIYDINGGFHSRDDWERRILPGLAASYERSDGGWRLTHQWEVEPA